MQNKKIKTLDNKPNKKGFFIYYGITRMKSNI